MDRCTFRSVGVITFLRPVCALYLYAVYVSCLRCAVNAAVGGCGSSRKVDNAFDGAYFISLLLNNFLKNY